MNIQKLFKSVAAVLNPFTYTRNFCRHDSYLTKEFWLIQDIEQDFKGDERHRITEQRYLNVLRTIAREGIALDPTAENQWGYTEPMLVDRRLSFYGLNYYLHIGGGFSPNNEREARYFMQKTREPESKQAYLDWLKANDIDPPTLG